MTIDTIPGLVSSPLQCGGWGEPERMFFTSSFDPDIHKIGVKFETVADTDAAVDRVSAGVFAYYENQYFLLDAIIRQWQRRQNRTAGTNGRGSLGVLFDFSRVFRSRLKTET